jgi:predicted metal-dependent hydrolase
MNVVDYVIVHELAHLMEPNHTTRFWGIVKNQVPKYLSAKEWLKEHGTLLEEEP